MNTRVLAERVSFKEFVQSHTVLGPFSLILQYAPRIAPLLCFPDYS